jgi:hypothetical protein
MKISILFPVADECIQEGIAQVVPRSRVAGGNVQMWVFNPAKEHELSRRAFKCIPYRWRSAAWLASIGEFAHES